MILAWARALRSITASAWATSGGGQSSWASMVHPRMALSGLRSSCETTARSSSLRRLASCSWWRRRSLSTSLASMARRARRSAPSRSSRSTTWTMLRGPVLRTKSWAPARTIALARSSPMVPERTMKGASSPAALKSASARSASNCGRV